MIFLSSIRRNTRCALVTGFQTCALPVLTGALLDRLKLDPKRLEGVAAGLEAVAALPGPAGQIIDSSARPNGLVLQRVRATGRAACRERESADVQTSVVAVS